MDRHQISQILLEMAEILEVKGENPFKIRAYENAARVIDTISNLEELVEAEKLTDIKGIGKNLADHITELYKTGHLKEHDKLKKTLPAGLLEILLIPGVGAKKVKVFWEKLNIVDVAELEMACQNGKIARLEGFGEKSQEKILQGIMYLKKHQGKFLYPYALASALPLLRALQKNKDVIAAEICGSLRRRKETIKDIDLLVATKSPEKVMDVFTKFQEVDIVTSKGDTKSSVVLKTGMNSDLRCVTEKEYPYALHHFTGSKEHNTAMRSCAKKKGLKMNEYGLFRGTKNVPCATEADIFKKLGLEFISPELREDMGEIEAAEKGGLLKLIDNGDVVGLIHVHSTYSDGLSSISELADAAKALGYKYLGICDHSQTAVYAGGLKVADLKKQWKEIEAINKKMKGFVVLKGTEVDVLADGALDYDDETLSKFDFVMASVHSRFNMTEDVMTARICKALSNKHVDILGHPTGRLLLSREGYAVDMKKVIDAAAKYKKVIELNANPHRLDVDWRWGPYLKQKGVKVAICPDAHSIDGFHDVAFGVGIARKAWLTKDDVVNTKTAEKFLWTLKNAQKRS